MGHQYAGRGGDYQGGGKGFSNGGRIISISSGLGTRTSAPGLSDYAGTKAAIKIFSKGVAHDLADRDITVNIIQAGIIDTDMAAPYMEANLRSLANRLSAPRVLMRLLLAYSSLQARRLRPDRCHHRYRWWVRGLVVPLGTQSLFIRSSMVSECSNNHSCR